MRKNLLFALTVSSMLLLSSLNIQAADNGPDYLNMSLQDMMDMEVTSVSKREEKASQTAAALYVITQEDIRRSGLQSVPELLRPVPGLQVAQSGSQNWAITSRGFDSQFSNKLLVLVDGRTVYNPVFSGVAWDVQNMILEDIQRIEVIRGPGATLWGANAVNGVINIITKSAKDTQGTLVTAATGTQERVSGAARYGGTEGDFYYRAYGQYFDYNQQHTLTGAGANDAWDNGQGGFRMDWSGSGKDTGTLQGDTYKGQENVSRLLPATSIVSPSLFQAASDVDNVSGANILGRWKHQFNQDPDINLQAYYDDVIRSYQFEGLGTGWHLQTFDLDLQHNLLVNKYNNITWGLGYRRINSNETNGFYVSFSPENYYENLYSGFLQDKISLIPDELFLTLGSKLEHNDFSGFEYEPSVRLAFTPNPRNTLWGAVSRAVRTPDPANQNESLILAPTGHSTPTAFVAEQGSLASVSEDLIAYEIGYRVLPLDNLSADVTGFYNDYSKLVSLSTQSASLRFDPVMGNYFYVPLVNGNSNNGETHGVELASTWEVTPKIKLNGSYTIYASHLNITGSSLVTKQGTAPNQQFSLRAYVDLPHSFQWDTMLYHVDQLPALAVPAYTRLDMRLGYTPIRNLDLSLIGQNLLRSEHQEFTGFIYQSLEEISRAVLAKATYRF